MAEDFERRRQSLSPDVLLPAAARQLLSGRDLTEAEALACPGAILFCDLSGFSRLGAEAVATSERGAETLQKSIDEVFAAVNAEIGRYGGSVLFYAGDAVVAYWPKADGLDTAVTAAAACGRAVQSAIDALSSPDAPLQMRAGVSCGDLWLVDCDTGDVRQTLFCGPALGATKTLVLRADGVSLTEDAADALGTDGNGEPILHDFEARLLADTPPALQADPWLRQHQAAGLALGIDWAAEFRQVAVLFLRLPDFTFDNAGALDEAAGSIRSIATTIEAEGGTLLQICCDDKGFVALAAWGLATSAWEDGTERAVRAAMTLADGDIGAFVSVASGKAFVGMIGETSYLQHVIIGDVVNRAAAICVAGAAPMTLDASTRHRVGRRFETQEVTKLALKGQSDPAPVFVVTGERLGGLTHAGEMIGRQAEKDRITSIIAALKSGERADMCLSGEAGLGKSRLAEWFAGQLSGAGVPHHVIQADGIRRFIGYAPFLPLMTALLTSGSSMAIDDWRTAILDRLGGDRADLLALLSPLLSVEFPETERSRGFFGAGRAELTRGLAAELVAKCLPAEGSVLVVEDAHWLDSASWQLLDELTRLANVSLCLVTRPLSIDDVPSEAHRFLDAEQVEILALTPLDREDSGALAAQALGAKDADGPLADLLHQRAAGHPLFTVALAQALTERGLVRIEAGYAHLRLGEGGVSQIDIPSDAAGAVREQISRLTSTEQLTIRAAAVLGRSFTTQALADIHPSADPATVSEDLARIAEMGLIEPDGRDSWIFHHAIIADAAYHSLVSENARALHAAAASQIARRANGEPDQPDIALMAYHTERAEDYETALRYLAAAAEGAKRAYANLEVVDFLTRALKISSSRPIELLVRAQWLYDIAYALRAIGRYQRAEDFLKECITALDRAPPETGGQAARSLIGGYAAFRLRPHRDEQPDDLRAPVILAADATMMLSEIHYELNKIPFALAEILRGANLARTAGGNSATLAKLYIGMALISTALPWALDGDDLQAKAIEIVDRLDDPPTEGWVYMVSGNYETGKGDWADGERYFKHAMAVSEACGERKTWETATSTLANIKRLEGRFEEAKGWSDITLAASRDRGVVHGIIWSHNGRARDLLCLSQWDEMRGDVETMRRLFDDPANALDANDNNRLVFNYTSSALALADGDDAAALDALEAALEIVARTKRPQVYMTQNAPIYCDLLWALHERGMQKETLIQHLQTVVRSAKRIGRQYRAGAPMAALAQGDSLCWQGNAAKAQTAWQASVDSAEERGMSYAAANALDRLARTGKPGAEAERDRHLDVLGIPLPKLWRLSA